MIKTFSTANGLLYINCIPIQEIIIPKLRGIFNEMVTMVASQVMLLSDEAVYKMESLAEVRTNAFFLNDHNLLTFLTLTSRLEPIT